MRKILSLSTPISYRTIPISDLNGLTFKSAYYARYSKRTGRNSNQQQSPSEGSNQNQSKLQNNQNDKDQMNSQQPENDGKITRPKRLLQMLKQGNYKILPFYLNNMIRNTRNPSLPGFLSNQHQQPQQNQSAEIKPDSSSVQQDQKNHHQEAQVKKKLDYFVKSSIKYKKKLEKKYKIIQSLKATSKVNSIPSFSFNFSSIFQSIKTEGFTKMLQDNLGKSQVYGISFLAAVIILFAFMMFSSVETVPNTIEYFQKNTELSDSDIQSKVNEIKEIRVKSKFIFGTVRQNTLTVVMKQQRKLSFLQQVLDSIGFNIEKNKIFTFDAKNPNLILDGLEKAQQHKDYSDWIKIKPIIKAYTIQQALWDTLMLATPFIGIYITYWIFTKVNPESMMKGITSNKKSMKIQSTKDIKVRFKDVAGMENSKKEITEFVDFLKNSQKYVEMGAKIPKGALLTGPPGTGKTMLAKACAGEAGTSFFYVSGSQFVEMFVGLGASRVRELFAKARQEAPSIIFIDEIDAIGKKRETSRNEEKDSTLNQMLVEMDGFSTSETVIVLAATNRKDILDSALTRPGRFDRMVEINLPELKARQQIFMVHLSPLKVNPNKPLNEIAQRLASLTPGFSGADIANLCNEAAIIATRKNRQFIEDADFEQASQRIMAGYIKKGLSNENTKKRVAYHEAGHAVCGWYLRGGDPLVKLTIIPRSKGALGYAQYLPKTAYIRTKSELIDQISIMLGGTTSEQVFLGNMSSGNSDDLQKVYGLARRMVTQFGMGARTYNLTLDEQTYVKKESEKLCNLMDEEMLQIVNQATARAKQIIQEKRQIVEQLAKQLLQKQTLNNEDILRIMGERPAFN